MSEDGDLVQFAARSDDSLDAVSQSSSSYDGSSHCSGRRVSSVHTTAALGIVDGPRHRRPRSTRSVHYADTVDAPLNRLYTPPRPQSGRGRPPSASTRPASAARPTTAASAALAGVLPSGGDRLKHLQVHMEQLQQLYAHEIHKEELAAREAFVQSMCTASITLWRYVCSKPQFFTAVKALLSEYLPAPNARLYEVEEANGLHLVLADGHAVAVNDHSAATMGVAGHAILAVSQLTSTQWDTLQNDATQRSIHEEDDGDHASSSAPSASSSDNAPSSTMTWLDRHAGFVMPSSSDHLILVIPFDQFYRSSGFHPEIDVTIQKKSDLFGASSTARQVLIAVLRDNQKRPLGAFEALVSPQDPVRIDFLDAFGSLLAAAMEARRSICRPTTGRGLRVHIVHADDASAPAPSADSDVLVLELAAGTRMLVQGSGPQSLENDLPMLEAVQKPLAELVAQTQVWQQRAALIDRQSQAERQLWNDVVAIAAAAVDLEAGSNATFYSECRAVFGTFSQARGRDLRIRVLFDGETVETFNRVYGAETPAVDLSVEGQFGALERVLRTGEAFQSTPYVAAVPVTVSTRQAAVLLISSDIGDGHKANSAQILAILTTSVELLLTKECQLMERANTQDQLEQLRVGERETEKRRQEAEFALFLSRQLVDCPSLDQVVQTVNRFGRGQEASRFDVCPPGIAATLFIVDYADDTDHDSNDKSSIVQCIWTTSEIGERVVVYDPAIETSRPHRGGMAAYVVESNVPRSYTRQHAACDATILHAQQLESSINQPMFFYAVPVPVASDTSRTVGVLEFAFPTESQQNQFAQSAIAAAVASTVRGFVDLHDTIRCSERQAASTLAQIEQKKADLWRRWRHFVTSWSLLSDDRDDCLSTWKANAATIVKELLPSASYVNLLVDEVDGDRDLKVRILDELNESDHKPSKALNELHQTHLRDVRVVPVNDAALLVIARESTAYTEEEDDASCWIEADETLNELLAQLLSVQLSRTRALAETRQLQARVAEVEHELSVEREHRLAAQARVSQQRILLAVHRLAESQPLDVSLDELLAAITATIAPPTDSISPRHSLHAAVVVSSGPNEPRVWRAQASSTSIALTAVQGGRIVESPGVYSAPFPAPIAELVAALSPPSAPLGLSWLVVSPLTVPSVKQGELQQQASASSPTPMALICGGNGASNEAVKASSFTTELVETINQVLVSHTRKRQKRSIETKLTSASRDLAVAQARFQAATASQRQWTVMGQRVFARLWTLLSVNESELTATVADTVAEMERHTVEQLAPLLEPPSVGHGGATCVRIHVHQPGDHQPNGGNERFVREAVREWLWPQEISHLLASTRRHQRRDSSADELSFQLDWSGSLAHGLVVAEWSALPTAVTTDGGDGSGSTGVVVLRVDTGIDSYNAAEEGVKMVVERVVEMAVAVQHVVSLTHRVLALTETGAQLTTRLEATDAQAAQWEDKIRQRIDLEVALSRCLDQLHHWDTRASGSSLCEMVHQFKGCRLWTREPGSGSGKSVSGWTTMMENGTRRVRNDEPSDWISSSQSRRLEVDGVCVAVVEAEDELDASGFHLLAAAVRNKLVQQHLETKMRDLQATAREQVDACATQRQREQLERADTIHHWHRVDALLGDGALVDRDTFPDVAAPIENDLIETFPHVMAMRIEPIELDFESCRIVQPNGSDFTEQGFDHLATLLGLWEATDETAVYAKTVSGSTTTKWIQCLFPTVREPDANVVVVAVPLHTSPTDTQRNCRSFLVLAALGTAALDCIASCRTLQVDARMIATAIDRSSDLKATRRQAIEAECAATAARQALETAQQWIEFGRQCGQHAHALVETAVREAAATGTRDDPWWSGVTAEIETFVQSVCGCDALELYAVDQEATDTEKVACRLVSLLRADGALPSPSLSLSQVAADTLPTFEATSTGWRMVCTIRELQDERAVAGLLVLHWEAGPASDSLVDAVTTIARPWLAVVFAIRRQLASHRVSQAALAAQLETMANEKTALELHTLKLETQLAQTEQQSAALQGTARLTQTLLQRLSKRMEVIETTHDRDMLWTSLVQDVASLDGLHGVQLVEWTETQARLQLKLRTSTLSSVEDDILASAMMLQSRERVVGKSLDTRNAHERRVSFQAEVRRVRTVWPRGAPHECLVLIFTNDHDHASSSSHQLMVVLDWYVDLSVSMTATRAEELEKMELQAAASSSLEASVQDLTTQRTQTAQENAVAKQRVKQLEALKRQLARELTGHEVWHPLDQAALAAALPTAKLVAMWRFVLELAQSRLGHVFKSPRGGAPVSVQLYGVVGHARLRSDGFAFSLPSQSSPGSHKPASKRFYCVALSALRQRREWNKVVQCIDRKVPVPQSCGQLEPGTSCFPLLTYQTSDDDDSDGGDGEDRQRNETLVGVLVVKIKALEADDAGVSSSLVQSFGDEFAPRIAWIGRAVHDRQQRQAKPSLPSLSAVVDAGRGASSAECIGITKASDQTSGSGRSLEPSPRSVKTQPRPKLSASDPSIGSNQESNEDGAVDSSTDEREAEQARDRRRASITAGVLAFSLQIQLLPLVSGGDSLRLLVARELKSVWTTHGDERKQSLDACELFFVADAVVRDRLGGVEGDSVTTAPLWLVDWAQNAFKRQGAAADPHTNDDVGLWKADASHWAATVSVDQSTVVVVTLSGVASDFSDVFDSTDESVHLPSLVQSLGLFTKRLLELQADRARLDDRALEQEHAVAKRQAEQQVRYDELMLRVQQEQELSAVTLRLLDAVPDERVMIQTALQTMKQWLQCDHVAFYAAPSTNAPATEVNSMMDNGDDLRHPVDVALETVLRVRVATTRGHETRQMVVGTMVARLTDQERLRMDQSMGGGDKQWAMRLLHRLADALAAAWVVLRQRRSLDDATTALQAASHGMEMQQQELAELSSENSRLQMSVDELGAVLEQNRSVEQDTKALRDQVEQTRDLFDGKEQECSALATKLKVCETQLVQVNCQLEQSIRAETQLLLLEQAHSVVQARETRLEKKVLKQKLQLKQLVADLTARREKDERDQTELLELRRQVAVLTEKQHHASSSTDASSVVTAVLQAQAQTQPQAQALQLHQATQEAESKQQQQQRAPTTIQRRFFRQMQLQQQLQQRKQLDLAHELRQLAVMEVHEMARRIKQQRGRKRREFAVESLMHRAKTRATTSSTSSDDGDSVELLSTKVYDMMQSTAATTRKQAKTAVSTDKATRATAGAAPSVGSKLRPPSVVATARHNSLKATTEGDA